MAGRRFLERYLEGEHVPVWRELVGLGGGVLDGPLRAEALRVCEEVVRRAGVNLRTLHARLTDLGYEFADPAGALVEAGPEAGGEIDATERELGTLPLIARVWYRAFAAVNFRQADHQRMFPFSGDVRPPAAPDVFGLGSHAVLVFQSLADGRAEWREMEAADEEDRRRMKEMGQEPFEEATAGRFLPLGGAASNCEPKGFELPCPGVDGVIYDDGGGGTSFVDELRAAFRWGGFPFWQWSLTKPDFFAPLEYRPNFGKLLPVLKDGLLDL
jgi:hypothetical protein